MHEAKTQSAFLDRCGIWLSSLCAVHCLALPVLIPLLPILASSYVAQPWFEKSILILSIFVGVIAMSIGLFRHHGRFAPIALLLLGGVTYWFKEAFGHDLEPVMVCIGAALIVFGHVINIRFIRQCVCSNTESEKSVSADDAVGTQ